MYCMYVYIMYTVYMVLLADSALIAPEACYWQLCIHDVVTAWTELGNLCTAWPERMNQADSQAVGYGMCVFHDSKNCDSPTSCATNDPVFCIFSVFAQVGLGHTDEFSLALVMYQHHRSQDV